MPAQVTNSTRGAETKLAPARAMAGHADVQRRSPAAEYFDGVLVVCGMSKLQRAFLAEWQK